MALKYKILGQSNPSAGSSTLIYQVPSTSTDCYAIISTITVCAQASGMTYRIAVRKNGESANLTKQYVVYDAPINANDTVTLTLGITLGFADMIYVYASGGSMIFNVYGVENS